VSANPLPLARSGDTATGPASPCVRNCCLDAADICLGCGRSLEEILAWHRVDAAGREAIVQAAAVRHAGRALRRVP
jgi:predicted Fe-S protein YdhL (DUF1289 family)